jgi:hypothetical protein
MKPLLRSFTILLGWTSAALAGPNAGGTIILHNPGIVYCIDDSNYCEYGTTPPTCEQADTRIDGAEMRLFRVYAAFPEGSQPRLKGMSFGVHYPSPDIMVIASGPCIGDINNGGAELPGPGWPGPDTGTVIVWQYLQTNRIVPCYWFAGYNYYSPRPAVFQLRDNPDPGFGGMFADDSIPSILDPIAGYGSLGFDTDGVPVCPNGELGACCLCNGSCLETLQSDCPTGNWMPSISCDPNPCAWPLGACCLPDATCIQEIECRCQELGGTWFLDAPCPDPCIGPPSGACCNLETRECRVMTESECSDQPYPHRYMGNHTDCDPNPCPEPVPIRESSWGRIKAIYR